MFVLKDALPRQQRRCVHLRVSSSNVAGSSAALTPFRCCNEMTSWSSLSLSTGARAHKTNFVPHEVKRLFLFYVILYICLRRYCCLFHHLLFHVSCISIAPNKKAVKNRQVCGDCKRTLQAKKNEWRSIWFHWPAAYNMLIPSFGMKRAFLDSLILRLLDPCCYFKSTTTFPL